MSTKVVVISKGHAFCTIGQGKKIHLMVLDGRNVADCIAEGNGYIRQCRRVTKPVQKSLLCQKCFHFINNENQKIIKEVEEKEKEERISNPNTMRLEKALLKTGKAEIRFGNPIFPSLLVRVVKRDRSEPIGKCDITVSGNDFPNLLQLESVAEHYSIINLLAQNNVYYLGRQLPDDGWHSEFQSF